MMRTVQRPERCKAMPFQAKPGTAGCHTVSILRLICRILLRKGCTSSTCRIWSTLVDLFEAVTK